MKMFHLKAATGLLMLAVLSGPAFGAPPKAKIIVAKSGGQYTSITAALNAITPGTNDRFIIDVWPGTYVENVTMKSYVNLQGSGRDVTTIQAANSSSPVVTISGLTNVGISGFTVTGGGGAVGGGILISSSTSVGVRANTITGNITAGVEATNNSDAPLIQGNLITNNRDGISFGSSAIIITENTVTGNAADGIDCLASTSSVTITGNTFSNNGADGIQCNVGSLVFTDNVVTGNGGTVGSGYAVMLYSQNGLISGNKITGNSGHGIESGSAGGAGTVTISDNVVTGNGGTGVFEERGTVILHNRITGNNVDIDTLPSSINSHISFNVFDTMTGAISVGKYNVMSNGTPW